LNQGNETYVVYTAHGQVASWTEATNAATGNTPVLDQVTLGVGGTRDYTWGAAGQLEEVGTMANPVDLAWDAAGRLASASRTAAAQTATSPPA